MASTMILALTGATGFIGRNLLKALLPRYQVRALVRPSSFRPDLPAGVEWIVGDLQDERALWRLLAGARVVLHLAGAIKGRDFSDFARTNVCGFQKLLQVAGRAGVERFLYISSLAAREPHLSPYAATKRMAEEFLKDSTLRWHIFRPPAVYGPGDQELTPLMRLLIRGYLPVFGHFENRFSLLYVEDLVRAILSWIEKEPPPFKIYELHDGKKDGYSWAEIREIVRKVTGKDPRALRIPKGILKTLAYGSLWGGRLIGKTPMLTPHKVNELCHPDWTCDNEELTKDTGWEALWPFERVLKMWVQNAKRRDLQTP